jgi:hypothetical protein
LIAAVSDQLLADHIYCKSTHPEKSPYFGEGWWCPSASATTLCIRPETVSANTNLEHICVNFEDMGLICENSIYVTADMNMLILENQKIIRSEAKV